MQKDIDEIAERILAIGGKPFATMSMYVKMTTLTEANADDTEEEIINQLIADFKQVAEEIQVDGLTLATENEDAPTSDLLTGKKTRFEDEIWKLQAFRSRD
jgi:starvation-inducible DNA-binding protein